MHTSENEVREYERDSHQRSPPSSLQMPHTGIQAGGDSFLAYSLGRDPYGTKKHICLLSLSRVSCRGKCADVRVIFQGETPTQVEILTGMLKTLTFSNRTRMVIIRHNSTTHQILVSVRRDVMRLICYSAPRTARDARGGEACHQNSDHFPPNLVQYHPNSDLLECMSPGLCLCRLNRHRNPDMCHQNLDILVCMSLGLCSKSKPATSGWPLMRKRLAIRNLSVHGRREAMVANHQKTRR